MPETLYIGSDINTAETKVLFDKQNYIDLILDKLGRDAGMYLESLLDTTYQNGYDSGYDEGYEIGYGDGYYVGSEE